jgi:uncharacterized membrane protein
MKIISWKSIIPALFLLLPFLPSVPRASAIGQITEPIVINDALRKMSYEETLSIINTETVATDISLSAEGEIAGWVGFFDPAQPANSIEKISLAPGEKKGVLARFTIPESAPNKAYAGTVSVSGKPGEYQGNTTDSGSTVTQKIDRQVTINVSDQENVKFDANLIPTSYDLAPGENLRIRVQYDNQGNIDIKPQIDLKIRSGEQVIYSAIFPYPDSVPAVKPGAISEIPALEIPTSSLANGKYQAAFKITQGEKLSLDKDFTFAIGAVKGASTVTKNDWASLLGNMDPKVRALGAMATILAFIFLLRKVLNRSKNKSGQELPLTR